MKAGPIKAKILIEIEGSFFFHINKNYTINFFLIKNYYFLIFEQQVQHVKSASKGIKKEIFNRKKKEKIIHKTILIEN